MKRRKKKEKIHKEETPHRILPTTLKKKKKKEGIVKPENFIKRLQTTRVLSRKRILIWSYYFSVGWRKRRRRRRRGVPFTIPEVARNLQEN